jgi:transposase
MANDRLPMNKIRDVLREMLDRGRSVRQTASTVGVSVGAVSKIVKRAKVAELSWASIDLLDDAELERRICPAPVSPLVTRPRPDPVYMHTELRRPGVTLELLHVEYLERHPGGLQYTAFADVYRKWRGQLGATMRQRHVAGEKCFVDFSGKKFIYFDRDSGEAIEAEMFVAVLGASNYSYVEAVATQRVADFIGAHQRALDYFEGVPQMLVPDQLKSAVTRSCRYEPDIQRTYADFAGHYRCAIVPARPLKPRDKAKVEVGVQIAQRWVLARLRNEQFFSLEELNVRVRELMADLNRRPMRKLGGVSRRELFERLDRPALQALPSTAFEVFEWRYVTVNMDYHVELDKHWYSVPYQLLRKELDARMTARTVELFYRGARVAAHARSSQPHQHTTCPSHMPQGHRKMSLGLEGVMAWAATVGPMAEAMVARVVAHNFIPEQGWRSARGLQRLGETYGNERMEQACARALRFGARSYKSIEQMLKHGRDRLPLPDDEAATDLAIQHENVRGPDYYN